MPKSALLLLKNRMITIGERWEIPLPPAAKAHDLQPQLAGGKADLRFSNQIIYYIVAFKKFTKTISVTFYRF